jgi:hypothetical protein
MGSEPALFPAQVGFTRRPGTPRRRRKELAMSPRRPTRNDEVPDADALEQAESVEPADEDEPDTLARVAARRSEVPDVDALEQALLAGDEEWRDGDG